MFQFLALSAVYDIIDTSHGRAAKGRISMVFALEAADLAFNTADIVVLAVVGLGLLAGLISGFARMLEGGFGTLIAIVGSVVLAVFLAETVANLGFLDSLRGQVESGVLKISGGLGNLARRDGSAIMVQSGGNWVALTEMYPKGFSNKAAGLAQTVLIALCSKKLDGSLSVAGVCAGFVTDLVAGLIVFVAGVIVLMILFHIVASMLKKVVSGQRGLRALDRFVGLAFGTAVCALIATAGVILAGEIAGAGSGVRNMIEDGVITGWLSGLKP